MKAPKAVPPALLAAASIAVVGCTEPMSSATACADIKLDHAMLVLESDRATSSALGVLDKNGCFHETADVSLGADPALSQSAGRAFVNVRDEGVVLEISLETAQITRTTPALRGGEPQPNPWDTAIDSGGRLWIARYNLASAAVVAPDGSWAGTVDLSSLADADGIPEMAAVTSAAGRSYVALEVLKPEGDRWVATGPGVVATAEAEPPFALGPPIPLEGSNPFGRFVPALYDPSGDTVTIVTPGNFDAIDEAGGVERLHLASGQSEVVVAETELKGSPIEAVLVSETEGYAIVAGPVERVNPTSIVRFDPSTRRVTQTLMTAASFAYSGLAVNGPLLVVGDHTYGAAALRVFDRATSVELQAISPNVLPPISILTVE